MNLKNVSDLINSQIEVNRSVWAVNQDHNAKHVDPKFNANTYAVEHAVEAIKDLQKFVAANDKLLKKKQ